MTRVVLFGGSGFVGSAIRDAVTDAIAPGRSEVDLADAESVRRFLKFGDVVINAAGYASATDRSEAGRARLHRENVEAVRVLALECERAKVEQLIHLSSVAAMGPMAGVGIAEADTSEPRSPYARSKREAERVLAEHAPHMPITVLRPTSVFGEGRPLATMLCRVAGLPVVPLPDGGRALIPFTYVGNVAAATSAAIGTPACFNRTFIVGDEQSYPLRRIVEGLAHALGRSGVRILSIPGGWLKAAGSLEALLRRGRSVPLLDETRIDTMTRSVSYSIEAFQSATGYEPPTGLEEALERIGGWYRRRADG